MQYAIKTYNWKGEVIGYQYNNSWVPVTKDGYYRVLLREIQEGRCQIIEPEITIVEKVYDKHGNLSGYASVVPFVPIDENNCLYKLIRSRIEIGECKVVEPSAQEAKRIDSFIICIQFDTPWKDLINPLEIIVDYPLGDRRSYGYQIKFINIEIANTSLIGILSDFYHLGANELMTSCAPKLTQAIMELTIPIKNLERLFRLYRKDKTSDFYQLLQEELEMHYMQTKRSPKEGPDISWLINFAPLYLCNAIIEIGCRALEAYSMEFGDYSIRNIDERVLLRKFAIIRKYIDDTMDLGPSRMTDFPYGYPHEITQNSVSMQIINNSDNKINEYHKLHTIVLTKIRKLRENGLYMEALSLLNGYLEVFYKNTIRRIYYKAGFEPPKLLNRLSYRHVLELFKDLSTKPYIKQAHHPMLSDYIDSAREIYKYRNLYLHELGYPNKQLFMSNSTRKHILDLIDIFTEPFHSHCFMNEINSVEEDCKKSGLVHIHEYIVSKQKKG